MTQDQYNAFIMLVQTEAKSFKLEYRIQAEYGEEPTPKLRWSHFQVYWLGEWVTLASEVPFERDPSKRRMNIRRDEWNRIKYIAAGELMKS